MMRHRMVSLICNHTLAITVLWMFHVSERLTACTSLPCQEPLHEKLVMLFSVFCPSPIPFYAICHLSSPASSSAALPRSGLRLRRCGLRDPRGDLLL